MFRRAGHRGVSRRANGGASPSLIERILAYGPAQWIRFTSENVTLNGGSISGAADVTLNARNVSQATGTAQPLFANPGADFDGSDDFLESATAFLHGIAGTSFFAVVDLAGETLTGAGDAVYGVTSGNWYAMSFGAITGNNGFPEFGVREGTTDRAATGPASISGATGRFLLDGRATSGSIRTWTNGVQGTENTAAWTGNVTANRAPYVGGLNSGLGAANRAFPGTIQTTLAFTSALSLTDQAAVRALLAQLYSVTL